MPASGPLEVATLSNRQLNRSLLARQYLLRRQAMPVAQMIEHLVGMQSQAPRDPFIGLWSRIEGFGHAELDCLMLDRHAVRIVVMRGTIHLLTARDAYSLSPVMSSMLAKYFAGNATYAPNLAGLDLEEVIEAGQVIHHDQPMTSKQLREYLSLRWPDRDPASLGAAVHFHVPLVQVTPRGVWGKSQPPTLTTVQAWLGEPIDSNREPDDAILRYLAAYGPATVADIQAWSGLQGLRESVERLRPRLVTYHDERNRELFDIPGAPFPDPETPAPVRFLPGFENALLSHKDRTRIVSDAHRKLLWKVNGLVDPTFLVDGYVAGFWKATRSGKDAQLTITPFAPLSPGTRDDLECEGRRLLSFVEDKAEAFEVRLNDPP